MSKLIFKPEMFEEVYAATSASTIKRDTDKYESAKSAQKAFDEWLEKQVVVYSGWHKTERGHSTTDTWKTTYWDNKLSTHKAYLVCIEEIKECEHEPADYRGHGIWQCIKCNKQLKPKNGWEEI